MLGGEREKERKREREKERKREREKKKKRTFNKIRNFLVIPFRRYLVFVDLFSSSVFGVLVFFGGFEIFWFWILSFFLL